MEHNTIKNLFKPKQNKPKPKPKPKPENNTFEITTNTMVELWVAKQLWYKTTLSHDWKITHSTPKAKPKKNPLSEPIMQLNICTSLQAFVNKMLIHSKTSYPWVLTSFVSPGVYTCCTQQPIVTRSSCLATVTEFHLSG